jgi:hypothetical protein
MRRGVILAGLAAMWAGSAAGQTVVQINGAPMEATCHLFDSRLNPNPGTPVVMRWDAAKRWYQGDGNGMTYRVVMEDTEWKVRAILPEGDFALAWDRRSNLGVLPLRWGGYVTAGPLCLHYGIAGDFLVDPNTGAFVIDPKTGDFVFAGDKRVEIEMINP